MAHDGIIDSDSLRDEKIPYSDFSKVKLKVARVMTAEKIEGADKLLKLTLDAGEGAPRTVLAGVAQFYQPEELLEKLVILVANLQPRQMRGHTSDGMMLAADVEGRPVFLTPSANVPAGSPVF